MLGKYTNLIIFLTAGAITLVAVVGVTFLFPPSGDDDYFPNREPIIIEVQKFPDKEPPPPNYRIDHSPPPPPTPEDYIFTEYDTSPVITKECRPRYPAATKKAGIEGDVVLLVFIDERGDVKNVIVQYSPGVESLEREAVSAAYKCKFRPASKDGEPVGLWYSLIMQFRL